jgi:hemerythrin-like domain-containing protein
VERRVERRVLTRLKEICQYFEQQGNLYIRQEEEALFPILEQYLSREQGPIGVMLREHSIYRGFLKEFKETLFLLQKFPESMALRDRLLDVGRELVQLLAGHIHKEERVLFVLANLNLTLSQKSEVLSQMECIRNGWTGHPAPCQG